MLCALCSFRERDRVNIQEKLRELFNDIALISQTNSTLAQAKGDPFAPQQPLTTQLKHHDDQQVSIAKNSNNRRKLTSQYGGYDPAIYVPPPTSEDFHDTSVSTPDQHHVNYGYTSEESKNDPIIIPDALPPPPFASLHQLQVDDEFEDITASNQRRYTKSEQ